LRTIIDENETNIEALLVNHPVSYKTHIGGGYYVSITSGFNCIDIRKLELGRYRFFKSVSVFVFWSVFSKVGIGFGIGFSKYRDIGFVFRFFRTNLPLLIE